MLVEDFSGLFFSVACVSAQLVCVSSFFSWRRALFKKVVLWLGLDHLRVFCGHFFFLVQLELRLHTLSSFSAPPFNTDFSACSVRRKRRGNYLAVIFCDLLFFFCVPSSLSHREVTRNQRHALMSSGVSVLLSVHAYV